MTIDRKQFGELHPVLEHTVQTQLNKATGLFIDFVGRPKVISSVNMRMRHLGISDPLAYAKMLRRDNDELTELVESVVIPETWFFRDRMPFQIIKRRLSDLLADRHNERVLRLLSVPCSTGEEAYSIAVCAHELGIPAERMQIDAMDVSHNAVTRAREAVYQRNSFRTNEPSFIRAYFQEISDGFRLKPYIRERVKFRTGNILRSGLSPGYDIILCRNLLIYFNTQTQREALSALHGLLNERGVLILGHSENPVSAAELYAKHPDWPAYAFQKRSYLEQQEQAARQSAGASKNRKPARAAFTPRGESGDPEPTADTIPVASPVTSLDTIKQLADSGRLREARAACLARIDAIPDGAQAYFYLAVVEQAQGNTDQVEKALRKAIYLDPNYYDALVMLACLEEEACHGDKAHLLRQRAQRNQKGRDG